MPLPIAMAHRLSHRLADVRKAGVDPVPAARRQEPGLDRVRRRQARRASTPSLISAQHREEVDVETLLRPTSRPRSSTRCSREFPELDRATASGPREPHRPLRDRRTEGGHRAHRAQDHRRHLRRDGAARRRRVQRQGPDEGRPIRGAYMARYVAKNIVAAGLADRCQLQVAYAIGTAHPVSLMVDTFGTETGRSRRSSRRVLREVFDFRPAAIIRDLDLRRPIYLETAAYGHFGRKEFPWEATDRVDDAPARLRLAAPRSSTVRSRSASTGRSSRSTGRSRTRCPRELRAGIGSLVRCRSTGGGAGLGARGHDDVPGPDARRDEGGLARPLLRRRRGWRWRVG